MAMNLDSIIKFFDFRRHKPEKKKAFYFNLFLGFAMMLFFFFTRDMPVQQDAINWCFDKYIKFRAGNEIEETQIANELIFLDFNNQSLQELNRPYSIPRDKIADLVNIAYEGDAKIIIIDIDFNEPDYSPEKFIAGDEVALKGEERDKILYDLLKTIRDNQSTNTKVLLPYITYSDGIEIKNIFSELTDEKKIYAVTPNFTENIDNNYTRFWLPYYKTYKADTNEENLLWSIPVMTMAMTIGNIYELNALKDTILNDSNNILDSYSLKVNRKGTNEEFLIYEEQSKGNRLFRDSRSNQYNRIQYTLIPPNPSTMLGGNILPKNIAHWNKTGVDNTAINCKDKIVIIGRGDSDCGDWHLTPVGIMPGMYVHGNAIATVLSSTQPHLCSIQKYLLIETLLIVIAAYVFLNMEGIKARIIMVVMILLCGGGTYLWFCKTNEFIFLSLSFTSIGVYNFSRMIENQFLKGIMKPILVKLRR